MYIVHESNSTLLFKTIATFICKVSFSVCCQSRKGKSVIDKPDFTWQYSKLLRRLLSDSSRDKEGNEAYARTHS